MKRELFSSKGFLQSIGVCAAALIISSCSGGGTASSSNGNGQLVLSPSNNIYVTNGSIRNLTFSLQNSSGVTNQTVSFNTSNPSIAKVTPSTCTVSSGTDAQSSCLLTVYGLQNGNVTITAQSGGYNSVSASSVVTDQIQYGTIRVLNDPESSYTALFPELQPAPYKVYMTMVLENSSGITSANPAIMNLTPQTGKLSFVPGVDIQQCNLSTDNPTCQIQGTLETSESFTSTLNPVGNLNAFYESTSTIAVQFLGTTTPASGSITLSTQLSAIAKNTIISGISAPIFVNWAGFNGVEESVSITLTATNAQFYQFNPGSANTFANTTTCIITPAAPNCGLNILPTGTGSAQVSVSSVSVVAGSITNVIPTLNNSPLNLNVVAPSSSGRTITFNNQSSDLVQLTLTSGAAPSFISPTQSATGGTFSIQQPSAASTQCGPSNLQTACPIGATCAQGGATPNAGVPYYCYWNQVNLATGSLQMESNTQATAFISNSLGITSGVQQIQWSGNYHVDRCPSGVCPPPVTGIGTGPNYPAVTLAEVTYQYSPVDYYDVSIINGVNYALIFGPTNQSLISGSNAYSCGQAGSESAQDGGWVYADGTSSAGLPPSSWLFNPTESALVGGVNPPDFAPSYFTVVNVTGGSGTCNINGQGCTTGTCGWDSTLVSNGSFTFESSQRACGSFVSWATADTIFGWNESSSNVAPFNFAESIVVNPEYVVPKEPIQTYVTVGNLQLCNNNTYSAYGTQPTYPAGPGAGQLVTTNMSCGGVNWNNVNNQGVGITRPAQQAVTVNSYWMSEVMPTVEWLKKACPTCYTFPYDDYSSTFTCSNGTTNNTDYTVTIKDLLTGG